jgi:hypothetical protein
MIDSANELPRTVAELERFLQIAAADPVLAEEFWDITDQACFIECVVRRGEALGCWFTAQHVEVALRGGWRSWLERAIP